MDNIKRTRLACYMTNVSMAIVANMSPILFVIFNTRYGISYSLLGLLILVNFVTQLTVDVLFSLYSHRFNMNLSVKMTPVVTVAGLLFYAIFPILLPEYTYVGLIIGTIIFAASGGLGEVLMSPVFAALPSEHPDKDMSALHAAYAWGVVFVIIFGTLFLKIAGYDAWMYLVALFAVIPVIATILFVGVKLPHMETPEKTSSALSWLKNKYLWLSIIAIFVGGACECTMAQWSSTYIEQVLGIPKIYGDLFGVALFSVMLGIGRSLYSKFGKNIEKVLFFSAVAALATYLIAIFSGIAVIGLLACAFTGLFVSMMWPGNIIITSKRFPSGGVFIFAIMAAAGDLGSSIVPQLVGIIADSTMKNPALIEWASSVALTPEQLGLKLGLLFAAFFPLFGIVISALVIKTKKHDNFEGNNKVPTADMLDNASENAISTMDADNLQDSDDSVCN